MESFPISFFKKVIDPLLTQYLKKWSGLTRSANTSLLFLSPRKGGLGLPSVMTIYKKQQVCRHIQLQSSRDPAVREVAQHHLEVQRHKQREVFRPAEVAKQITEQNVSLCRKSIATRAKALVATEEDELMSSRLQNLPQQGKMMAQFEGSAAALWSKCVGRLPPEPLSFILNATVESLPTNDNLCKWGKRPLPSCALCHGEHQSLLHILNDCPTAMILRHYSARHDEVLQNMPAFVGTHLPPSFSMSVDSAESEYLFPHHITPTNLRPDVVWWSDEKKQIRLLELTISYETVMDRAHERKLAKYEDVVVGARARGYDAECIAVEVGSRGLIVESELQQLKDALGLPAKAMTEVALSLSRAAILGSYRIWCSRNIHVL